MTAPKALDLGGEERESVYSPGPWWKPQQAETLIARFSGLHPSRFKNDDGTPGFDYGFGPGFLLDGREDAAKGSYRVETVRVRVNTNLRDRLSVEDLGKLCLIGFRGWAQAANKARLFTVRVGLASRAVTDLLDSIPKRDGLPASIASGERANNPDDDLPF